MNHGPRFFGGILAAFLLSWAGLVMAPQFQLGSLGMTRIEDTGQDYPPARSGEAVRGARVYQANGCQYCHTQVVRGARGGGDLARGWGGRRTVPRDYLRDAPVMLGGVRYGPDLTNVGSREDDPRKLLLRLYDPRLVTPGSTMPRYPYLFEERRPRPGERRSAAALDLPEDYPLPKGVVEVVPRPEALRLVAYLRALRAEPLFFEVFPPLPPGTETNAPSASRGTNAPSARTATNAPAGAAGGMKGPPDSAAATNLLPSP